MVSEGELLVRALLAIVLGVAGAAAFYWLGNFIAERLPKPWDERVRPYVFIAPAVFVVGLFLVYPLVATIVASFRSDRLVRGERPFVGLENYQAMLTNEQTWDALLNNLLWVIFVPTFAVIVGLLVAVLADRVGPKGESIAKSLIFLPMAISFVGASAIWLLVYRIQPESRAQTGLLNALLGLVGISPVDWLRNETINDFALMAIMVWLQAGFAMVLLSAAIKNVPEDTLEAARIDGASEVQIFFRIIIPQIASTLVVVLTTILILVLKVFDVVRVLTAGRNGTEVIANFFYTQFVAGRYGSAGVLVVLLLVITIPFMILNIRRFREQEATR